MLVLWPQQCTNISHKGHKGKQSLPHECSGHTTLYTAKVTTSSFVKANFHLSPIGFEDNSHMAENKEPGPRAEAL